jgi:short-subunit dehydrogenase
MKALVTGASSGIGRDIARELSKRGIELVLTGRREEPLLALQKELLTKAEILIADLSRMEGVEYLCQNAGDIDILVNNAGFGLFGNFDETQLSDEIELMDTNMRAVHSLTKYFLKEFRRKNAGYILNVSSSAAFLPGPKLSSYYASKAYVLRLSEAIYEELRRSGSNVSISIFCPGPVRTAFNERAGGHFQLASITSEYAARCAVKGMLRKKMIIIPGIQMKLMRFFERFTPEKLLLRISYHVQVKEKKRKRK